MRSTAARNAGSGVEWYEIVRRVSEGDRLAFLKLSRLVTGFLASWQAFDFRDDWDDFVQEVVLAAVESVRAGRIEDPAAMVGYVKTTARFKFTDRLRRRLREDDGDIDDQSAGCGAPIWASHATESASATIARMDVREALSRLPEKTCEAVIKVYMEGRTYSEAALDSGIPLGSLKRFLRQGIESLELRLATVR